MDLLGSPLAELLNCLERIGTKIVCSAKEDSQRFMVRFAEPLLLISELRSDADSYLRLGSCMDARSEHLPIDRVPGRAIANAS